MSDSEVYISYKVCEPQLPPVILLHGLTSAKETWDEIAKDISDRTGSKVYSLDARNHGDSGWSDEQDYEIMADDLVRFMDLNCITKAIIIGHSMGGKTAMSFALKYPERVCFFIVEDVSVRSLPSALPYIIKYIRRMKDSLLEIPSNMELNEAKRKVAAILSKSETNMQITNSNAKLKIWDGLDLPLMKNEKGEFEWKSNLDVMEKLFINKKWGSVSSEGTFYGPVLMIYGTKSPYKVFEGKHEFLKQFPNAVYEAIEDGTHSLHLEYPEIFSNLVCDFILKQRTIDLSKI